MSYAQACEQQVSYKFDGKVVTCYHHVLLLHQQANGMDLKSALLSGRTGMKQTCRGAVLGLLGPEETDTATAVLPNFLRACQNRDSRFDKQPDSLYSICEQSINSQCNVGNHARHGWGQVDRFERGDDPDDG